MSFTVTLPKCTGLLKALIGMSPECVNLHTINQNHAACLENSPWPLTQVPRIVQSVVFMANCIEGIQVCQTCVALVGVVVVVQLQEYKRFWDSNSVI